MTFKRLHYAVSFLLKRGVTLKKIISIFLTFFILIQSSFFCFYSTPVYGGLLDVDPDLLEDMANNPEKYEPATMKLTEFLLHTITGGQALDKFFGTSSQELISNIKALFLKEGNCKTDGNNYYLTQNFVNEFNKVTQDQVRAFDGYYLVEPKGKSPQEYAERYNLSETETAKFMKYLTDNNFQSILPVSGGYYHMICPPNIYYYIVYNKNAYMGEYELHAYDKNHNSWDCARYCFHPTSTRSVAYFSQKPPFADGQTPEHLCRILATDEYCFGLPVKIFYSKEALQNYLNNNGKRTYVPQLPSGGFKVNIKYINNSTSLPDITYNITTENKTETEIQNQYDTTINNYLNNLDDFSDGGGGATTPTPTPSGGGSGGDFGDGTTPTPKPDFGDGSDLTDTNDWLKKIYEWLQSFGDTHSKFEQTITDYIEANDGKLDQIIEAINALSDGKTEDEKNGCKYDFTALSDFMTKLWNESDKKFDKMVELLEENNKYQKKLVNSLNEIKAILVTQTIMDVFQDRSQQTAEKAKDKFPTSLPWDIALVVNAMSAEPEKPQFNLPIQIKSLNINEEIHVDLASGEWERLARTCRYLLSILFILLMIQLSLKLFSNGGDD